MKKLFVIAASAVTIVGTGLGLGTLAVASAQTPTTGTNTAKHGKGDKRQDMRARIDARLNQAVRDGTITADQKTAITVELKSLNTTEKASLKAATTKAERQAARQTFKTSLQAWATSNNFPLSKIFPKL